ncbi:GGDEF domain-containing protein [Xanthobacter sp. V4C-4]|uniref:GGDEF domain-containing protein n=1 Tax=Xanthobacter cornucopiae TaxID=3119924 RepID=UPI0037280F94
MMLHVPTLMLTSAMISGLVALLQVFASRRLQNPSLRYWAAANIAVAVGGLLLGLRGDIPMALSVVAGNGLIFAALGLMLAGVRVFDGKTAMVGTVVLVTLAGAGLLAGSLFLGDDLGQRIIIASIINAGWCLAAVGTLWPRPQRDGWSFARGACAVLLLVLGISYLARTAALGAGWMTADAALTGASQAVLVTAGLALATSWNFCSLYMVLDRLVSTDDLTGLLNRRTTLARGRLLLDDARARRRAVSVLMVDLDHFKSINDRFGHHVGDAVLQRFAEAAARELRSGDVIGRLGGEEFCAILPGADADAGREVGERLRRIAERELRTVVDLPIHATVTVGVATLDPPASAPAALASLMQAADLALYEAKADGRNRVGVAGRGRPSPPSGTPRGLRAPA